MTTPFQPNEGDTVEFYNEEAELWEPGTIFSSSADHRFYFVQPDDENQPMHDVEYTNIRPLTEPEPAVPSFWEAAKTFCRTARVAVDLANNQEREIRSLKERQQSIAVERNRWASQAGENAARARIAEKRAERAEADLTQCRKALHDAIAEAAEVEKDRDGWAQEAKDNQYISRMGYEERDQARARVKELEAELAKLRAQTDAAPYATGYPVGDRVAARLAEYRERTHAAEADRDEYRKDWQAAESRVEELEDQNRVLKSDLDHARAAGEVLQRVVDRHRAETWTDAVDGTVRNLGGITRAELAQKLYDENERAGRAVSELAELKKALATLAGAEVIGTELP